MFFLSFLYGTLALGGPWTASHQMYSKESAKFIERQFALCSPQIWYSAAQALLGSKLTLKTLKIGGRKFGKSCNNSTVHCPIVFIFDIVKSVKLWKSIRGKIQERQRFQIRYTEIADCSISTKLSFWVFAEVAEWFLSTYQEIQGGVGPKIFNL